MVAETMEATQAAEFLGALWGDKPDNLYVLVWALNGKRSAWFADVAKAAEWAAGRNNMFVGVGLSPEDYGAGARCKSDAVAGLAGFWADIDYQDGAAHKGTALPADGDAAMEFAVSGLELRPSLVVHSGHGIQAWWLFAEPWVFAGDADRNRAAALSVAWQGFVGARGKVNGWKLDSTHDLARVMRIPGTFNVKDKCPSVEVRLLDAGPQRYMVEDFERACELTPGVLPESSSNGHVVAVVQDPERDRGWMRGLAGSEEGSRNQDLTSLAGILVSGMLDLESEPHLKANYLSLLNANAKSAAPLDEKEVRTIFYSIVGKERRERAKDDADRTFLEKTPGAVDAATLDQKLELVGGKLGGLKIIQIIKRGREETECSVLLVGDREILLTDIHNQAIVRKAIANATSPEATIMLPRYKHADWDWLVKIILSLAVEQSAPDMERKHRTEDLLAEWFSDRPVSTGEQVSSAIAVGSPFERDGFLHINVPALEQWMRGRGIATAGISKALYQCGFGPGGVCSAEGVDKNGNKTQTQKRYRKRSITKRLLTREGTEG